MVLKVYLDTASDGSVYQCSMKGFSLDSHHAILGAGTIFLAHLRRTIVQNDCAICDAGVNACILDMLTRESLEQARDKLKDFDAIWLKPSEGA